MTYNKTVMFRKYEKTYRIVVPEYDIKGKRMLSAEETKYLLGGQVIIEEKFDGANTGIIRHKNGFHLQKRGSLVSTSEHAQFQYFHNWASYQNYDKCMSIPKGYIVYGELMYAVHNLYYDRLPDYFIVFDVWNGKVFLNRKDKEKFCQKHGFAITPLIFKGYTDINSLVDMMPTKSSFGDEIEGFVVKKYTKKGIYVRGKVVRPEFIKGIGEHWTKSALKINKVIK